MSRIPAFRHPRKKLAPPHERNNRALENWLDTVAVKQNEDGDVTVDGDLIVEGAVQSKTGDLVFRDDSGSTQGFYDDSLDQWHWNAPLVATDGEGTAGRRINGNVGVVLQRSTTQAVPDATNTTATWDNEVSDVDGWHSASGIVTVPHAGWYIVTAGVDWSGIVAGDRVRHWIELNSSSNYVEHDDDASRANPVYNLSRAFLLAANDTVRLRVWHNGGAGVALASSNATFLSVAKLF